MPVDVVCGKAVPVRSATPRSVFHGRSHYFCSKACKARFDAHPARFAFSPRPSR